ncbi:unnamed protein product [Notodromas monacha]|uniref:C-factor n=1 Tax=Notodromas monacha TaxID=399045 RepID=A0A7R9BW42_9CRUS|nr:unnamed protein product [Notodromas monacha]CAG0922889.1 unnamed protein product [Notodromas monacha]
MAKTVMITGSSRGIGLALVKECLSSGLQVIATCRNPSAATELADLLKSKNQAPAIKLDVEDRASIKDAFAEAKKISPTLDILINNAGVIGQLPGLALETTPEDMLSTYKTNVVGPMLVNQEAIGLLRDDKSNPSIVVNMTTAMASIAENGSGKLTAYRCSKVALNMLNMNFSQEKPGVVWIAVHPGWVDTDMGRSSGAPPPLSPQDSASGILKTVLGSKLSDSGAFLRYNGEKIPW